MLSEFGVDDFFAVGQTGKVVSRKLSLHKRARSLLSPFRLYSPSPPPPPPPSSSPPSIPLFSASSQSSVSSSYFTAQTQEEHATYSRRLDFHPSFNDYPPGECPTLGEGVVERLMYNGQIPMAGIHAVEEGLYMADASHLLGLALTTPNHIDFAVQPNPPGREKTRQALHAYHRPTAPLIEEPFKLKYMSGLVRQNIKTTLPPFTGDVKSWSPALLSPPACNDLHCGRQKSTDIDFPPHESSFCSAECTRLDRERILTGPMDGIAG